MAAIPHVLPGQVIRANLINQLIDFVNGSGSTVPSGVEVPDLFGRTLSQARIELTQPALNLALGTTLDAFGTLVDPNAPASQTRLVIGQAPPSGVRVPAGSAVNLVLAAQGSGPSPQPKPIVTGFNQASTPINQPITLLGDNFDLAAANNTVTFDSVPAGVPNPASKTSLTVVVPNVPGVPKTVNVVVTTPGGGSSTPQTTTILPPLAGPNPSISNIDISPNPVAAQVGQSIKINGANFDNSAANNTISFDTVLVAPSLASPTQLTVTVPNIPGVNLNQPPKSVSVTVKVGAKTSPAVSILVEKLV